MTTHPADPGDSEEVLAKVASQVAQQSRTLALHVRQHGDMEEAAQEKADAVIDQLRSSLEAAHQAAVKSAAGNIQSELDREFRERTTQSLEEFRASLGEITREHTAALTAQLREVEKAGQAALSNATETIRKEREEQRSEYQQLRSETVNTLTELMNTTLEESARATAVRLEEHARTVEREQTERTETALSNATQTMRSEREEQRSEYQQLRSETVNTLTGLMNTTLEENAQATTARLEEHARTVEQEQTERTEAVLAVAHGKWRMTSVFTLSGTVAAVVIAAAALAVAVL